MSRRRSIDVEGFGHSNPIPAASRVGPLLASGIVGGIDPATGEIPPGLDEQCALVFRHVRAIVEAAGGDVADIVKMTFYLEDHGDRAALNREWAALFPDPASRPARQAMPGTPNAGRLIECDFLAYLDDER